MKRTDVSTDVRASTLCTYRMCSLICIQNVYSRTHRYMHRCQHEHPLTKLHLPKENTRSELRSPCAECPLTYIDGRRDRQTNTVKHDPFDEFASLAYDTPKHVRTVTGAQYKLAHTSKSQHHRRHPQICSVIFARVVLYHLQFVLSTWQSLVMMHPRFDNHTPNRSPPARTSLYQFFDICEIHVGFEFLELLHSLL